MMSKKEKKEVDFETKKRCGIMFQTGILLLETFYIPFGFLRLPNNIKVLKEMNRLTGPTDVSYTYSLLKGAKMTKNRR